MASNAIDDLLDEVGDEAPVDLSQSTASVDNSQAPTREELLARLRSKKQAARQGRTAKPTGKKQSFPLRPIFYCDRSTCQSIMEPADARFCPVCRVYCYCSKNCQSIDWVKHKLMCGKTADADGQQRLAAYREALVATETIYNQAKDGDYLTVIHEKGEVPACLFASIAEKSNVLHWRAYLKNMLFTTTSFDTLGQLGSKVQAAIARYPNKKIYLISTLLDRVHSDSNSECVIRLYVADAFGATMEAPTSKDGKITVPKYVRKVKAV